MGPGNGFGLHFDPKGADFTAWVMHMRYEVYRNWIMPKTALLGVRGHVDIELTTNSACRPSWARRARSPQQAVSVG
jgi:hypothetical protein